MKRKQIIKVAVTFVAALFFISACGQSKTTSTNTVTMNTEETKAKPVNDNTSNQTIDTATFGAGCFWCVEAVFQRLEGVISIKSGYSGGTVKNPSYREVCNGTTGHAEVCQIEYDKTKISFDELLEVFWKTHDPTTLNSQGNDHGTQYRSAIFYHNEEQKAKAERYKKELNEAHVYPNPIVTQIAAFTNYYPAEDYHQNYYNQNGSEGYCRFVIQPKVEKFEKIFKDKMKKN
ncbi:peptide-methionine (S)-S-oxide reductase MsrA [Aurantibacillus circumpalustris]|uniref:peptide-methionine (S)-S-oxide reductase MsrA n=1 Tax=Aurantibacillus circumpalustris TaxID=3036359 RepID=UPI00295AC996|nr:peptide-methionine (S)-S-oxide reductase MsrA [Aurantibacillus circumpalustris]